MKALVLLPLSALLAGCASGPEFPDAFAAMSRFAAVRARETKDYGGISPNRLMDHVTQALLDLDCYLVEADRELGVITARGRLERVSGGPPRTTGSMFPDRFAGQLNKALTLPAFFYTCAGGDAVVTITVKAADQVGVRASLHDQSPQAAQHFFALLDNSLSGAGATQP